MVGSLIAMDNEKDSATEVMQQSQAETSAGGQYLVHRMDGKAYHQVWTTVAELKVRTHADR